MRHENHKHSPDRVEWQEAGLGSAPTARVTPRSMDEAMQHGRRLRAQAMQDFSSTMQRSVAGAFQRLARRYRRWRAVRKAENELRALSPQMLRDIGIHRSQIPAVARGLDVRPNQQLTSAVPVRHLKPRALAVNECCVDEAA